MRVITNWLKGKRDFTVGAMLYQRFGKNEQLKLLLDKGETPFLLNELAAELQKMAAGETEKIAPAVNKEVAEIPDSKDPILQAIRNEWLPLYGEMNLLRHELDKYGNSNSKDAIAWRQPRARKIKDLEKECMAIWAKADYYKIHGKLPFVAEKSMEIPTDPVKLAKLINNTKKNIRRNRLEMEKPGANPKHAQLYLQYKTAYLEITKQEYDEKN